MTPKTACSVVCSATRIPLCPKRASRRIVCRAKASEVPTATQQRAKNGSMIRSLAAAVELNSQVQRYETFAGRSAMVGLAVAAFIEVITDHSVFFPVNNDTATTYACVALGTLATAVGIAFARGQNDSTAAGTGIDTLEAVYASLTAVKRSAASVTQAQVDKAVDYILETVLAGRFDGFSIEGLLMATTDDDEEEF
ncbi:hypothetical protein PLESTF_001047300 [Pleodorina starrii]|nr:hypothetical protein PLESTM_001121800 [Pleodorina starrii]GLC70925.1 hypothetical protein PLESTF_001047300 [Pleodorina starrii]